MGGMREIRFRGKDMFTGRWAYGDLVHNQKVTAYGCADRVMVGGYEADPETVGQFTGLKDKNGKESYFGDIVRFTPTVLNRFGSEYVDADYKLLAVIEADRYGHSVLRVLYGKGGFDKGDICHIEGLLKGEIVGNIFDNPDLQEGDKK